jgi:hypothetical protein
MGSATIRAKTIGFCFLRRRREAGGEIPPAYSPGMPSPTFLAFVPMGTLAQNDDLLNLRDVLHEAEGEAVERMQQIARAAYAHTENNLYAMSVWSKISNALKKLDFWSRNFLAQLLSQTSGER